jgi:hypothetical protein
MDTRDYEKDWPGLPIKYLIVASKEYIVFLDNENDIDWKTSDAFDAQEETPEQIKEYYSVKNEIDSAESTPTNHLDEKVVIGFKRQLGEALVRAFEGDYDNARKMVKLAKDFILKRNIEQSRFMYLVSCGATTAVPLSVATVFWLCREQLILNIGNTVFFIVLSVLIGSFGALLSVILRMGKTTLDYNASKKLHYLEGSSRVIAGMISAFIVALCIRTEILLPIFTKIESTNIAMVLGGLIAGASERFAPSIINKLDSVANSNKE